MYVCCYYTLVGFCEIIFIRGDQCLLVAKIFLGCGDVNIKQMLLYIYIHGDGNLWARVTHESHEYWSSMNNDDSTVCCVRNIYLNYFCFVQLNSSDRALINAFREIGQMGDRLNLPRMIAVSLLGAWRIGY